jgi:hypothetical protein
METKQIPWHRISGTKVSSGPRLTKLAGMLLGCINVCQMHGATYIVCIYVNMVTHLLNKNF